MAFKNLDLTGNKIAGAQINVPQAVNNVTDVAPTLAELTTSFGAPSTLGRGFIGTVDDADADARCFLIMSTDGGYYWVLGTKAV